VIIYNYLANINYFDYLNVFGKGSIMKRRYQGAQGHTKEQATNDLVMEVQAKVATED
jgi:hypothetical protein